MAVKAHRFTQCGRRVRDDPGAIRRVDAERMQHERMHEYHIAHTTGQLHEIGALLDNLCCGKTSLSRRWIIATMTLRVLGEPSRYMRRRIGRDERASCPGDHVREQRRDQQSLVWRVLWKSRRVQLNHLSPDVMET